MSYVDVHRTHETLDTHACCRRYHDLLTNDGGKQEARELQAECAEGIAAVESRLGGIYIEARVDLINDMLDEYFEDDGTDWQKAPLPTGLRDCALEIIDTLVNPRPDLPQDWSLDRRIAVASMDTASDVVLCKLPLIHHWKAGS